jgi:hypothetical protein
MGSSSSIKLRLFWLYFYHPPLEALPKSCEREKKSAMI